jgi:hypothetical protein
MLKAHRSTGDNHWVISRRLAPAVALALVVAAPAAAHAADVVTPRNGDVVGSQPQFTFDFAEGSASVELSKSASVKTSCSSDPPTASLPVSRSRGRAASTPGAISGTPSSAPSTPGSLTS